MAQLFDRKYRERFLMLVTNGLWALFAVSLFMTLSLALLKINNLPLTGVYYAFDGFDTVLTIKIAKDIGIFDSIPYFDINVSLFGYMPILFPLLGSLIDQVLNDPPLSMLVLYTIIEASIFLLFYKYFLEKQPIHIKILFGSFFLFNLMFASVFPLGQRRRQQLALLMGMLLFLNKNRILISLLSFLSILAQPFTGFLMVISYLIHSTEKRFGSIKLLLKGKSDLIFPALLGCLLAIPFYHGLITGIFAEPDYYMCNNFSQSLFPSFDVLLFSLFAIIFLYDNRNKLGASEVFSSVLIFYLPAGLLILLLFKDILPFFLFGALVKTFSITCPSVFINVGAFSLMAAVFLKKFKIRPIPVLLILLLTIYNIGHLYVYLTIVDLSYVITSYQEWASLFYDHGIYNIKTITSTVFEHSGNLYLMPIGNFLRLQGYNIFTNGELHFVDEVNLPPEMSRGEINIANVQAMNSILQKNHSCSDYVEELRQNGVEGLSYRFQSSAFLPDERYYDAVDAFNDTVFLNNCSLDIVKFDATGDYLIGSSYVIYKIRQK